MSHLNEKRGELKEVMDKLQNLNDDYRSKVNKKQVGVNYGLNNYSMRARGKKEYNIITRIFKRVFCK